MGDLVNLRTVRKRKARDEKSATAAENRVLFGRTKSEKALQRAETEKAGARLDGHKRDGPEPAKS